MHGWVTTKKFIANAFEMVLWLLFSIIAYEIMKKASLRA